MSVATASSRNSSASNEHYTPDDIVARATRVLGGIDLDPASCALANKTILASTYYDATTNGFTRPWFGSVFLNPPGGSCDENGVSLVKMPPAKGWFRPDGTKATGRSSQKAWWFKLMAERDTGRIHHAIFVCFSVELLQSAQNGEVLHSDPLSFPICFPSKRVDYLKDRGDGILRKGGAPPHASAIVYVPPMSGLCDAAVAHFVDEFSSLGRVINT